MLGFSKTKIWVPLMLLLSFAAMPAFSQEDGVPAGDFVVVCPVVEEIGDGTLVVVKRAIESAEGASAIVFRINTPGGRVDSAIEIASAIMEAPCPTIAYVEGMGAISAGALISYACDYIVMAPATNIGASMPIMVGVETTDDMNEKSMSFVRAKYRALGEENGHNPLLGEAMVDRDIELRGIKNSEGIWEIYKIADSAPVEMHRSGEIAKSVLEAIEESTGEDLGPLKESIEKVMGEAVAQDDKASEETAEETTTEALTEVPDLSNAELISPAGKLLTLTGNEALEYGLAVATVDSLDDALAHFGHEQMAKREIVPTWEELLFAWLTSPTIAGLLLMAGIGGIITEIRTPGFGIPGIVGGVCLFLFFGAHLVLGMANWIDIALVTLGIGLILVEIFVLPGFGIAGVSGIACVIVGIYFTLTKVTFPEYHWDFVRLEDAGQTAFTAALTSVVFAILSWKLLPHTPFPGWLTLSTEQLAESGYTVQDKGESASLIGLRGQSLGALRPAGKGRFANRSLDIVTRGEFLEKGVPVEIIEVEGNRIVVAQCDDMGEA